jgi:hypothetical protein
MDAGRAHQQDDTFRTHPAPPESGAGKVVPVHVDEALRDQRRAVRRLLLLGTSVWPAFFLVDLFGAYADGAKLHVEWLFGWRLLGALLGFVAYTAVRDVDLSARWLRGVDAAVFVIGSVLITMIAIPFGGLSSRFVQGVALFVFARAALIPSHWKQALTISLLSASMMPITMAAATLWSAAMRADWSNRQSILVFAHNALFVVGAAVIGSIGSHVVWTARRLVYELRRLGSYRLKTRIGGGGVGDVWLAWQDPPGREVALKVLRDEALNDPDLVRRFDREARAARRLVHPNTIRILDYGASADGVRFIAMELLHGLDVDALVRRYGPISPARLIYLAQQACGSLAEAHGKGIIHRDIKPANLFVARGEDGGDLLKVLDFGLARILRNVTSSSPSPITPEGIICGTPAFISPESISGEAVDARSDVYSLGAVLYFMATGTVVFPHLTITESVLAHAGRTPEPPSQRYELVPPDLERVILRCLAKRPANRFPSAAALANELGRCADAGKWTAEDARAFWESGRVDHSATHLTRK